MRIIFLSFLLLSSFGGKCQDYSFLKDIQLKTAEDYKIHERTVIEATNFILKTSTNENKENRIACSNFILDYGAGVPDITISLSNKVLAVTKKNPEVLIMFMGLWIKTSITNRTATKTAHLNYVYTEIGKYCARGNGIKNTRIIRSLKRAYKKDKIEEWVLDRIV